MRASIILPMLMALSISAQQMPSDVNRFSLDFLKNIREKGKNTFCSPLGVYYVNAMLYAGANGLTQEELEQVMRFNDSTFNRIDAFSSQINKINTRKQVEISIANGIWNRIILKDGFRKIIQDKFDSESFPLTNELPINRWAEEKTNGKIKNLLPSGSINSDVVTVLANAIYFKGDWLYKFDSSRTRSEWFYKEDGNKVKTDLMHIETNLAYYANESYQMLELPYKGEELFMRIFLPAGSSGINDFLKSGALLNSAYARIQKVKVYLPKMEIETNYDLIKPLSNMGLKSMFTNANFSRMADMPLKVDKMLQKAYLKVDETGTEAAAVTVATMMTTSAVAPVHVEVPVFRADRPFLFTIIHKKTGTILFAGTMESPETMKGK